MNDSTATRRRRAPASNNAARTIDPEKLEELAKWGCSIKEAADWFDLTVTEMRARLKDPVLKRIWTRGPGRGRAELRGFQFKLAERNQAMAIHVGRHLLGQTGSDADRAGNVKLMVDTGIRRDEDPPD